MGDKALRGNKLTAGRTGKSIGGILKGVGKVWQGAKKIKNPVKKIDKLVDDLDYVDTKKYVDDEVKLGPIWKKIKTGEGYLRERESSWHHTVSAQRDISKFK